jgi:muconate cycloisomerase
MRFRLDANEAWSAAEAAERIRALESADIASIEQPVAHEDVAALKKIRTEIDTPVMLDESLCSMMDARQAVDGEWCDLFNLRLSKCGGFLATLRLAEFAHQQGIGIQLGCQVGETGILSAAGRHFACTVAGLVALEGSYDRHLLHDPFTSDMTFGRGGKAHKLTKPGLGVTVDTDKLDAATIQRRSLLV